MTPTWLNHFNKDVFDITPNLGASPQDAPPNSLLNANLPFEDGLKARWEIKSWNNYHASNLWDLDELSHELGDSQV